MILTCSIIEWFIIQVKGCLTVRLRDYGLNNKLLVCWSGYGLNNELSIQYSGHGLNDKLLLGI